MTLYIIEVKSKRKGAKWKPVPLIIGETWVMCTASREWAEGEASVITRINRDVRVSRVKVVR